MRPSKLELLVGIGLFILGLLLAVGVLSIPYFQMILAVGALVSGILMILETLPGPRVVGIVLIVFGVLLLATSWLGTVAAYIEIGLNLILGGALAILGVLKLFDKW